MLEKYCHTDFIGPLKAQNYKEIVRLAPTASSQMEIYLVFRVCAILGLRDEFAKNEVVFTRQLSEDLFLSRLVGIQKTAYLQGQWKRANQQIQYLRGLTENPFLATEINFLMGFFSTSECHFSLCLPYYREAIRSYVSLGLPNHAAHAYFNLCVGFDHLRERDLLKETLQEFSKHVARNPEAQIAGLLLLRMKACWDLDEENYASALLKFQNLWHEYERHERYRDMGAVAWVQAYLLLKLKDSQAWNQFLLQIEEKKALFSQAHLAAIEGFIKLSKISDGAHLHATAILVESRRSKILDAAYPFWLDLMCEQLEKRGQFEDLLKLSKFAQSFCVKKQQDIYLIDFRYYEILSRIQLYDQISARYLLNLYLKDAEQECFQKRIKKASNLDILLASKQGMRKPVVDFYQSPGVQIVFDKVRHELFLNGWKKDLKNYPMVEKGLWLLGESSSGVAIEEFCEKVYEQPYSPLMHERRISSLIHRMRLILGSKNSVIRREGLITLDSSFFKIKKVSTLGRLAKEKRKSWLLKQIKKQAKPLAVSEIQTLASYPRRTLQLDLFEMVREGFLSSTGIRKAKKYSALTDSAASL